MTYDDWNRMLLGLELATMLRLLCDLEAAVESVDLDSAIAATLQARSAILGARHAWHHAPEHARDPALLDAVRERCHGVVADALGALDSTLFDAALWSFAEALDHWDGISAWN
jgi:hypothetical protein